MANTQTQNAFELHAQLIETEGRKPRNISWKKWREIRELTTSVFKANINEFEFDEDGNPIPSHIPALLERAELAPLSGVQEYAIDLYERGLNVFPIPSAYDWNLRGETKKKPYKLEPLFRNRLHYVKDCYCLTCYKYNFVTLFEDSNIAIMCGATSGNILSIDCDSQESFELMRGKLAGLPYFAFTSHRGGQYLMRVIEGEVANIPQEKSKFEDVQIWGSRHFCVIPPSIHPKGTMYEWLAPEPLNLVPRQPLPAVSVTALDWLGVTLKKYRKSENEDDINGLPEYAKNLSHASRHILKHGAKHGGRNSALCALAAELVGIGLIESEVETAVQMAADNCLPPYPSNKNDAPIQEVIDWAFSKERKPSRSYQTKVSDCVQDWQRAQYFEDAFNWRDFFKGKSLYARRVYHACIERAKKDTRAHVFRASVREISMLTNMTKDTAQAYLKCLESWELLEPCGQEKSGANKYRFSFNANMLGTYEDYVALCADENPDTDTTFILGQYTNTDILLSGNERTENNTLAGTDAERDAFHKLGVYAFAIWRDLLVRPAKSNYEIAKRLKLSEKTVRATVERLVTAGLACHSQAENLYFGNALTDAQLAIKAAGRGTAGKTQDKRTQFTKERERYVNRVISEVKDWYKGQSAILQRRGASR